jgi:MFS family permease
MDATATPTTGTPVATPEEPQSGPAMLLPLRLRDFRLVFTGETISLIGDQFHFIALAWLALQLTGSGVALGTVLMAAAIPRAVFMLLGGAMSDRVSPRSLMIGSNARPWIRSAPREVAASSSMVSNIVPLNSRLRRGKNS